MSADTIIIGGGPAGSAAAILLAKQGIPVRLLERRSGAHHKVCGEFISFEAAHYLEQLGLDLPALGAEPIRHVRIVSGEKELRSDLPFVGWSLSRRTLDAALLELAQSAGAEVDLGTTVKQLTRTPDGWEIITRSRSTSRHGGAHYAAKNVFLASGKHELRNWQRHVKHASRDNLIGLKMHLQPKAPQQVKWQETVEVHLFDGGYAGIEPIEQGGVNLCFLIEQDIYKSCGGSWSAVLDWLGSTSRHTMERLSGLTSQWQEPLAISGVPYGYVHSPDDSVAGLFRLGDQAAVIPSFAGDGIAIALHSASLAAQTLVSGDDAHAYHRKAHADFTRPVRYAKRLADVLSNPAGRKAAFLCARVWPKLLREVVRQTRVIGPPRT